MSKKGDWSRVRTIAFGILAGVVASVGTLAVTVAGFALSYDAIRSVGIAARIRVEWAWLLPVSIDGAMAVATIAAVVLHRMTGRNHLYPWLVVIVGAAISVVCNGLHALAEQGAHLKLDEWVRFAVSAIPAVMLALSVHLLVTLVEAASGSARTAERVPDADASPVVVPVEDDATPVDDASPDPWSYANPIRDTSHGGDATPEPVAPVGPEARDTPTTDASDVAPEPVVSHDNPPVVSHPDDNDATPNGRTVAPQPRRDAEGDTRNDTGDPAPEVSHDNAELTREQRIAEAVRLVTEEGQSRRAAAIRVGLGDAAGVKAVERAVSAHVMNGSRPDMVGSSR